MNDIVSIGRQDRSLTTQHLDDPKQDEWSLGLIKYRCEKFVVSKESILEVVDGGGTQGAAEDKARELFNAHVEHESQLIASYQMTVLKDYAKQEARVQKEENDLVNLEKAGRHRVADRTVVDIPKHEKRNQYIYLTCAWLLLFAGVLQMAIFMQNTLGWELWKAIIAPLTGVVAIGFAAKAVMDVSKRHQPLWFNFVKYGMLLAGVGCALTWVFLFSEFAVTMSKGPQFTDLEGQVQDEGHGSAMMIAFQVLAEAFIAGFLFTKVKDITDRNTRYDGIGPSEDYKIDAEEAKKANEELSRLASRKAHSDSLLDLIRRHRKRVESEAASLWRESYERKIRG